MSAAALSQAIGLGSSLARQTCGEVRPQDVDPEVPAAMAMFFDALYYCTKPEVLFNFSWQDRLTGDLGGIAHDENLMQLLPASMLVRCMDPNGRKIVIAAVGDALIVIHQAVTGDSARLVCYTPEVVTGAIGLSGKAPLLTFRQLRELIFIIGASAMVGGE